MSFDFAIPADKIIKVITSIVKLVFSTDNLPHDLLT